ncbi:MAG: PepSY-associated TM helix domain-containing protein [Pseudoalteromonas prydzensis]|uniref:PepSY-associated TM helix domain-containing protein n=1 Tax=Pseudoalteromonas prydzensis TaxID=182141 RepID=UPI003F9C870E
MKAKQWFNLHAWAGLFVGILLLITCLSGTLATLSHEIEYLSDTQFRALTHTSSTDFVAIENTLAQRYPGGQVISIMRHQQPYLATEVSLKWQQQFLFVYVDGATGQWLGEGQWGRVSRFLRNWHMNLSMGWTGKLIVTSLAIVLVILVFTSPIVYRQWWRHFLKKPRQLQTTNRSSWADWHKLLGLWSYWFIVVMAITGVWYLVEHGLQTAKIAHYVTPPATVAQLQSNAEQPLATSTMIGAAQQTFPSLLIRAIQYPTKANKPVVVLGDNDDILVRLRANKVYLDAASAQVLAVQKAAELPLLARIKDTADPLHFGNFAGLGTKLIWAVFGFLMTCICMAGLYMNWLRVKRKQPSLLKWFGVIGVASMLLIGYSLLLTVQTFSVRQAPPTVYSPVLGISQGNN